MGKIYEEGFSNKSCPPTIEKSKKGEIISSGFDGEIQWMDGIISGFGISLLENFLSKKI